MCPCKSTVPTSPYQRDKNSFHFMVELSEALSNLWRDAGLVWGTVRIWIKVSWFQVHYIASPLHSEILGNCFQNLTTNLEKLFWITVFSIKASGSTAKVLIASKSQCCCETDNCVFHLFHGTWRRKLTKPLTDLQSASLSWTDDQLCKYPW